MADVVKKVNRTVPPTARTQLFTSADAGQGDVIMVEESLGKAASYVSIEAVAPMQVRFNVYHTVYQDRQHLNDFMDTSHLPNLTTGTRIKDTTVALINIDAAETLTLDNDLPVRDIELATASGSFNILCS